MELFLLALPNDSHGRPAWLTRIENPVRSIDVDRRDVRIVALQGSHQAIVTWAGVA